MTEERGYEWSNLKKVCPKYSCFGERRKMKSNSCVKKKGLV